MKENDFNELFGKKEESKRKILSKEDIKKIIEKNNNELLKEMSSIKTFKGREKFCKDNFEEINVGSSRRIFDLRNGTALKLAKNSKGLEQNSNEMDGYLANFPNVFTPTHKGSDSGEWIIMDSGRVLSSEKEFKQNIEKKFGIDFELFELFCNVSDEKNLYRGASKTRESSEKLNKFGFESRRVDDLFMEIYQKLSEKSNYGEKNQDLYNFIDVIANTELICGDFLRKNSWGFSGGSYKILDYGLNKDNYNLHYNKKRGANNRYR